jgi:hypothetical protein
MAHPTVAATTTHVPARVLSSKVAVGASGSKGVTSAKKTTMPVRKCHIHAIGAMTATSSEESQESSPHNQVAQDSITKIASRLEPRGQSSRTLLPGSVPRLEPEASLQITTPLNTEGVSILDVTTVVATC